MTMGEIKSHILLHIQELQNEPEFNQVRQLKLANRGLIDFARRTKALHKVFTITTVANQEVYDVDNQILKITNVTYVENSTNEFGRKLLPWPGGQANLPKTKTFGKPNFYYIVSPFDTAFKRDIGTIPIVSTSSETLNVYAYYTPAELATDTASPSLQESYHDAIVEFAVWKAFSQFSHKKPEYRQRAQEFMGYYFEKVREAQEEFSTSTDDEFQQTINVYY